MSDVFARRLAQRGVGLLRVAVMEVLYRAWLENKCVGGARISELAGIFRETGFAKSAGNDDIVWGVLSSLVKTKHVTKCKQSNGRAGWKLVDDVATERRKIETIDHTWGGDQKLAQLLRPKQWGMCVGCLAPLPRKVHVDHVQPRAQGGPDTPENKRLLCPSCNMSRGQKPWGAWLEERFGEAGPWPDFGPDC